MTDKLTRAALDPLALDFGDAGWFTERRAEAFELSEKLELPDPKGEEWRYVDVRDFDVSAYDAPRAKTDLVRTPEELPEDVVFSDLSSAMNEHPDLVKKHFFTDVPVDEHIFTALHGAFLSEGFVVHVPKNVEVAVPLEVSHDLQAGGSVFPHATIVVEENASVTLVETFRSPDAATQAMCSSVVEIEAGRGSTVNYISLQQWGRNVRHFQTQRFTGERDSTVRSLAVNLGSTFARTQVESVLKGEGSFSEMLGLYFADTDQHFAQRTLQSHNAEHTTSDLLYKGALKERSRSEYSGLIKVLKGAQGTDAYQANRNLVLSEDALARSIPQLEIEANEVRCTHGATVSPVEEEHLFYLMSRGIDRMTAQKLIVFGFFGEVLDRIRVPSVRDELSDAIAKKVEGEQRLEVKV